MGKDFNGFDGVGMVGYSVSTVVDVTVRLERLFLCPRTCYN